jgi:c-di-GMP-binding flagellar brake protein YcgR
VSGSETRSKAQDERRKHPRIPARRSATIYVGSHPSAARLRDLAHGGACLVVETGLERGLRLELELRPARGDAKAPLRVAGRVVWCTALDGGFQVGVAFPVLDRATTQRVARLLSELQGDTPAIGEADRGEGDLFS